MSKTLEYSGPPAYGASFTHDLVARPGVVSVYWDNWGSLYVEFEGTPQQQGAITRTLDKLGYRRAYV